MTWPIQFGSLFGGNEQLLLLDQQFQQTAQMLEIPCAASGATAISLTPLVNCPVLTGYTEFCAARFRAAANSSAGVTAQVNGLGFLPVYRADGVTQCGLNDLVLGFEYVVRFSQALGGGVGGWFLEAPAVGSGGGGTGGGIWTPGGRLTLVAGNPVALGTVSAGTNSQTIYYAPYAHPFVPVFNGSSPAMYQFTSGQADTIGLSLAMAGSGTWPAATMHDLFVTLSGGVPVLGSVQWTSVSARATNLAIFGGFLTNSTLFTMRLSGGISSISVPANQGTYVGTFGINPYTPGESVWHYGSGASGGGSATFLVYNYYNQIMVNTAVIDTGAPYTYTANSVRPARNSITNAIYFVQGTSEKPATFQYNAICKNAAAVGAAAFIGLGTTTTSFTAPGTFVSNVAAQPQQVGLLATMAFSVTGSAQCLALEFGDGVNANTFNNSSDNILSGQLWL